MRRGAGLMAGAAMGWALMAGAQEPGPQDPGVVVAATLEQPTDRYTHGVFGDPFEWGALRITLNACPGCATEDLREAVFTLPLSRVFEDITARLADLDGDGRPEVIVVETDADLGASLAVYDGSGKRAATAFIGQARRWLAPAGVGDFDGDGRVEVAYIDRPHLAQDLVFVRLEAGQLRELARHMGFTNHRFGDPMISGGVRRCGGRDRLILATGDWTRMVEVGLDGAAGAQNLGPIAGPQDLAAALICP